MRSEFRKVMWTGFLCCLAAGAWGQQIQYHQNFEAATYLDGFEGTVAWQDRGYYGSAGALKVSKGSAERFTKWSNSGGATLRFQYKLVGVKSAYVQCLGGQ